MKYKEVKSIVNNAIESNSSYEAALNEVCRELKLNDLEKSLLSIYIKSLCFDILTNYFNEEKVYLKSYVNMVMDSLKNKYNCFYYPLVKIYIINFLCGIKLN